MERHVRFVKSSGVFHRRSVLLQGGAEPGDIRLVSFQCGLAHQCSLYENACLVEVLYPVALPQKMPNDSFERRECRVVVRTSRDGPEARLCVDEPLCRKTLDSFADDVPADTELLDQCALGWQRRSVAERAAEDLLFNRGNHRVGRAAESLWHERRLFGVHKRNDNGWFGATK